MRAETALEELHADCAWVKTNFESRREKRKAPKGSMYSASEAEGMLA